MVHGPLGAERGDYQAGLVASIIANVNRDTRRRSKPFTALDFLVFSLPDVDVQGEYITSAEGLLAWMRAAAAEQAKHQQGVETRG